MRRPRIGGLGRGGATGASAQNSFSRRAPISGSSSVPVDKGTKSVGDSFEKNIPSRTIARYFHLSPHVEAIRQVASFAERYSKPRDMVSKGGNLY